MTDSQRYRNRFLRSTLREIDPKRLKISAGFPPFVLSFVEG